MRNQVLWLALCTSLGLSACATNPQPQFPSGPLDTSKACAEWRWIGISRPGARCPEVRGWTVRPLFPQLAPAQREPECPGKLKPSEKLPGLEQAFEEAPGLEQASEKAPCLEQAAEEVPGPEVIRELNRFCVYEIADWEKKKRPFPPTASAELVRFDQDCAALALTDTDLVAKDWMPDSKVFLAQAGQPQKPLEINNPFGVRLAFLDTQPTGEGVPEKSGNSLHGFTLAHLAQELVCTAESAQHCAARITTRLAMPIIEFDPEHPKESRIDPVRGGFLGMQSDLAEAIRNEVDSWQKDRSQRHLVLNLSMAWDGELFGGLNEEQVADMRAGTQAVYRALQYAAGFDVLVLAAAGNQKQEPCANFGPLLPAAWERGAPKEESCRDPEGTPLVYAVGGVRADGSPLANARLGGIPRRVAYGETEVFTGSSVATAVVSSIAAVVWDTYPDLKSYQVMDRLDRTGEELHLWADATRVELPWKADFWFGASPLNAHDAPAVRRLSLCNVLQQACSQEVVALPTPVAAEFVATRTGERSKGSSRKDPTKGSCQPWLFPQPEYDPCPTCPPPKAGS